MRAMLHGFRRVDLTDEQTGRNVRGFSCFIGYPASGVEGQETSKVFFDDSLCAASGFSPRLGEVEIDFTPKGRPSSVRMISAK